MDRNKVYIIRTELDEVTQQVVDHIHVASDMIDELNENGILVDRELFFEALEENDNQVAVEGFGLFWVADEGTTLHFVPASSVNECLSQHPRFREVTPDFSKVKAQHELAGHELQMLQSRVSTEILDCLHLRPVDRDIIPLLAWKPKGNVNLADVVGLPYNTRIPAGDELVEGHIIAKVLKTDDDTAEMVGWDVRECDTTGDGALAHHMHYMGTAGSKQGNIAYYRSYETTLHAAREVRIMPNSPRTEKIVVDNFLMDIGADYAELHRHDRVTEKEADGRVESAVNMGLHVTGQLKEAVAKCKELEKQNTELTERVKEEANANVQLKLDIKHVQDTVNAAVNSVLGEGSNTLDSEPNPVVEHLDRQNSNLGKENVALRERAEKAEERAENAETDAQKWKEHLDKVGPTVVRRGDVIDELNDRLKEAEERADHAADVAKKKGAYIEQVCSERDKFRNEVERLQKQIRELKK